MPDMQRNITDVVIIGAGPVGLFAIFELGMLKIRAHVIDTLPQVGGQCVALYPEKPIYDIPGFPSVEGAELIAKLAEQAAPFSPTYHLGQQVIKLDRLSSPSPLRGEGRDGGEAPTSPGWRVTTNTGTIIDCKAVIIAAGCGAFGPNRPPMEGLEHYEGTYVHYMVASKEKFRGQTLVIAGGGDSAVDWANALSPLAEKIYVVHRRDKFRAAPESVDQMKARPNVEMVIPYQLKSITGDGTTMHGIEVETLEGESRILPAQHLLAFFGLSMELGPIADWGLGLDMNHITVHQGTSETSEKGIFAIGDIATYEHKLKLILTGFAEAASAAHKIRDIVYPGQAYHFEYSTSKGVPNAA